MKLAVTWVAPLVVATLLSFSLYSYYASLEPVRSMELDIAQVTEIARQVLLAAFAFSTAFCASVVLPLPWRGRSGLVLCHFWFVFMLFELDQGADFAKHGLYNLVAFCFLVTLLSATMLACVCTCWLPPWRLKPVTFVVLLASASLVSTALSAVAHDQWRQGLQGRTLDESRGCDFDSATMFPAQEIVQGILPISYPIGSPCTGEGAFARWDDRSGEFQMVCDERPARYKPLPPTRERHPDDMAGIALSEFYRSLPWTDYSGPVTIIDTEVIVAECGQTVQHLYRVAATREDRRRPAEPKSPNVVLLQFDAVSRRHLFRRLPKTVAILERLAASSSYSQFQFFKYHSTGINTQPNTHPLYTGGPQMEVRPPQWFMQRSGELKRGSFPIEPMKKVFRLPYEPIWHQLNETKYVTGYTGNACSEWSSYFHDLHYPADHEMVLPFCSPEYYIPDNPFGFFVGSFSQRRRCLGGHFVHNHMFRWMRKFRKAYADRPTFLVAEFMEGHEGTGEVIKTVDDDLSAYIEELFPADGGGDTVLFLMSDHGLHMSPYYLYTRMGLLENKLPLLVLAAPNWYIERHPAEFANVTANEQSLFASYAIHHTLRRLFTWEDERLRPLPKVYNIGGFPKPYSLFDRIPSGENRTCAEAGILDKFCGCIAYRPGSEPG